MCFVSITLHHLFPSGELAAIPGAKGADEAVCKTVVAYASAGLVIRELSLWLVKKSLVVGDQAINFCTQFSWLEEVE
jgi:hypothetical protein